MIKSCIFLLKNESSTTRFNHFHECVFAYLEASAVFKRIDPIFKRKLSPILSHHKLRLVLGRRNIAIFKFEVTLTFLIWLLVVVELHETDERGLSTPIGRLIIENVLVYILRLQNFEWLNFIHLLNIFA